MDNQTTVQLNGIIIGQVYLGTHGAWVAQPAWATYSCSFATKEQATIELMLHYQNREHFQLMQ